MMKQATAAALALLLAGLTTAPQASAACSAPSGNVLALVDDCVEAARQVVEDLAPPLTDLFPTGAILIHDPGTGPAVLSTPPGWSCSGLASAGSTHSVTCNPPLPPLGFVNKCGVLKSDGIGFGVGAMEVEVSCATLSTTTGPFFTGPSTSKVFSPTVTGNSLFPVTCEATLAGTPAPWWAHCVVNPGPPRVWDEAAAPTNDLVALGQDALAAVQGVVQPFADQAGAFAREVVGSSDLFPPGQIIIHAPLPNSPPTDIRTPNGWSCTGLVQVGAQYTISCTPPLAPLGFVNKCGVLKSDGIGFNPGAMEVQASCGTLSTTTGPFFTGPPGIKRFSPTVTGNQPFPLTCTVTVVGNPAPWWAHCFVNSLPRQIGDVVAEVEPLLPVAL